MKIEQSQVIKLLITNVDQLDPVTVYVDDSKITIECYGKAWTTSWGGKCEPMDSFAKNGCDYIVDRLAPHMKVEELDFDELLIEIREKVFRLRRDGRLSKLEARELYDVEDWSEFTPEHSYDTFSCPTGVSKDVLKRLELHFDDIPTRETVEHAYLKRIIKAVQAAFIEIRNNHQQ